MNVETGTRLGPYEIVAPIGAGGMGEVFRARDTRLDRTVAIKVLPASLAASAQLRQRFEREAKAISALAHPHICTLHDIGSVDGVDYLVMEHLEGESLADRLAKGPLPVHEAIRYGIEIADALDKAHRRGIIHRDLKPGNVMITRGGAKLLDFGLARTLETEGAGADDETVHGATAHKPLTEEGTIVGTMQYMAPEQLESRPADARTDIFAFGALMYEMLTGRRAFAGKSRASVIAAILAAEPQPVSNVQPLTPRALERVVRICLEKDPDDRWQSAHDLKLELQGLTLTEDPIVTAPKSRRVPAWAGWIAALVVAAAALAWFFLGRASQDTQPSVRFEIAPPPGARFNATDGPVVVSPDGQTLAFRVAAAEGREALWIRRLGSTRFERLRGTDGGFDPFWSPDGRQLAFFTDGKLKKIDLASLAVSTLCSIADSRGGTWAGDTILFSGSPLGPVLRVPASGGTPVPVTALDATRKEAGHWRPFFLPDGSHFLYTSVGAEGQTGVYVGSLDSKEVRRVLDLATPAIYSRAGMLVYINDGTLYAQPFDAREARTTGPAFAIASDVEYNSQYGSPGYSVGGSTLAWQPRGMSSRAPLERITLDGKVTRLPVVGVNLDLSDDGRYLAMMRLDESSDIWTFDLQRGVSTRTTFTPGVDIGPVWSPDGKRFAFSTAGPTGAALHVRTLSGGQTVDLLTNSPFPHEAVDWSPDGRTLLIEAGSDNSRTDLVTMDVATRKMTPFVASPFNDSSGRFSPDGRWIAYESDESGGPEVYLQPFPPDGSRLQVSSGGGRAPRWTPDGRRLFYADRQMRLISVPILHAAGGIDVGPPAKHAVIDTMDYVLDRDAKSVIASRATTTSPQPLVVTTNWSGKR